MLLLKTNLKTLRNLVLSSPRTPPLYQLKPIYIYTQISNYVDVKMKWKKDSYYDTLEIVHGSHQLKPLIALKNCIIQEPDSCIPISAVSKRGLELDVPIKVAKFLRQYPSVFQEFTGPHYDLPWFRLTTEAIDLHKEEQAAYEDGRNAILDRLKRFIFMSQEKRLPLKIIHEIQWYLGFTDEFLKDSSFRLVEMRDGLQGLEVVTDEEMKMSSLLHRNAVKRVEGEGLDASLPPIAFPLFPSKGLRLKVKISNWLDEFQKLPYVSPYEDCTDLNRSSDVFEKRVVGVLHELLCLFVNHSVERKRLFCLRPYLGLPQKFYKAFERHPHIFYLSLRNKTCTAILKEAYNGDSVMETHPLSRVRGKYIKLMKKSETILKRRRKRNQTEGLGEPSVEADVSYEAQETDEIPVPAF